MVSMLEPIEHPIDGKESNSDADHEGTDALKKVRAENEG